MMLPPRPHNSTVSTNTVQNKTKQPTAPGVGEHSDIEVPETP